MISEPVVHVARTVANTCAEGPGIRYAIWVQGCTIRCPGCFNPHLWASTGGTPAAPDELVQAARGTDAEGITLLGGEPFDQAAGLAAVAKGAQRVGLTVMTFTGHLLEGLRARAENDAAAHDLLDATDLLVDGPYLSDQPDLTRPWVGSTNQRFHFLTARYMDLEHRIEDLPDRIEVRVAANGAVALNGWAPIDKLDDLLADTTGVAFKRGRVR